MSEFKIITQAELLTKSRELRDRVEISLHKLGPGAKSFQQSLNSIVAGLSVQNAHPVDDKQPSLFDSPRVGQPRRKPKLSMAKLGKTARAMDKESRIKAERAAAGRTNSLVPKPERKPTNSYLICSKCSSVEPDRNMTKTAGRRWVCKNCAKKVAKTSGITTNKSGESVKRKAPKKVAKKIAPRAKFMELMQATPELQAIIGMKPLPLTGVTKKIWDYIKKNNLQDKANRRNINVDEALGKIFANKKGVVPKQVSMFEMTKLVTRHLTPVKA